MTTFTELAVDLLIIAFIGLLSAGYRHIHDGKCEGAHGSSIQASANARK